MKYALKIDTREHAFYEPDGTLAGYSKLVMVRTPKGRRKAWKVGTRILDDERRFHEFRTTVIEPWVLEEVPMQERPTVSIVRRHVLKLDPLKLRKKGVAK